MASKQPVQRHLSLVLSELLSDIGINDEMINRKRELASIMESLNSEPLLENDGLSYHFVGGLSDGSATLGAALEDDIAICETARSGINVIQDLTDWRPDLHTLLTIQDNNTPAGYCRLQLIDSNTPRPATIVPDRHHVIDDEGRILLKRTYAINRYHDSHMVHGPVRTLPFPQTLDLVVALRCTQWPLQARNWLNRTRVSEWPNAELKLKCIETGFFVVPVSSYGYSDAIDTEWRISFSRAEMCLMFSLNAVQMGCYALMKILLKSHINNGNQFGVSSYIWKTILFYCIEENALDVWQKPQLIYCLTLVLQKLYTCILQDNCPDYFIPEKNLFQSISIRLVGPDRLQLLYNIQYIVNNIDTVLLGLKSEDIGSRLRQKLALERKGIDHDNKMEDVEPEGFNCDNGGIKAARSMNGASVNIVRRSLKFLGWCAVVYGWIYNV